MKKIKGYQSTEPHKEIVHRLIKDDITNTKLVTGLDDIGLDSGKYYLHLSDTIFELMGFKDSDLTEELWEGYFNLLSASVEIEIFQNPEELEGRATEIYGSLIKMLKNRKP